MLTQQRKAYILEALRRDGEIVAKLLSEELQLSEDTIRRDLRELAAEGKLQRVHGGALPASPAIVPLAKRREVSPDDKVRIGKHAASLVRPGQIVILDGGTTTTQLARHLPRDLVATVVTHSPGIAVELIDHPGVDVVLLGGTLFKHSMVTVGSTTIEALSRIRADVCFLGVTGIHPDVGLSTGDYEEAAVKRALIGASAETIVLASPEKLGAASPYVIAPVTEISTILTVTSVPYETTDPYEKAGIHIIRAQ